MKNTSYQVRFINTPPETFEVETLFKLGNALSPQLFKIAPETLIRRMVESTDARIK